MRIFKPCKNSDLLGKLAVSLSGRDAGIYCVIVDNGDNCVYIANGRGRRVEKPKKKKLKHLRLTDFGVPNEGVRDGKIDLTNRELRSFISEFRQTESTKNDVQN